MLKKAKERFLEMSTFCFDFHRIILIIFCNQTHCKASKALGRKKSPISVGLHFFVWFCCTLVVFHVSYLSSNAEILAELTHANRLQGNCTARKELESEEKCLLVLAVTLLKREVSQGWECIPGFGSSVGLCWPGACTAPASVLQSLPVLHL